MPNLEKLREWRRKTGRDENTGQIKKMSRQGKKPPVITDVGLIVVALRMAAYYTTRDDLRPEYKKLADEIERLEVTDGDDI